MSDHQEIEPLDSAVRACICGKIAFEPEACAKCENGDELCTDCRTKCDVCGESYCKEHLEHHGCKRLADPADVLMIESEYARYQGENVDAVYSINGRVYFEVSFRGRGHEDPPDVTVHRYNGVKEKDVWVVGKNADGYMAQQYVDHEEVGFFDGVLGRTVWDDVLAEQDHREASDDR